MKVLLKNTRLLTDGVRIFPEGEHRERCERWFQSPLKNLSERSERCEHWF